MKLQIQIVCFVLCVCVCFHCKSFSVLGAQCFPQRAALLKSMLNFLKKAIPENVFSESIRHCKLFKDKKADCEWFLG
jgi:hypothetical protein